MMTSKDVDRFLKGLTEDSFDYWNLSNDKLVDIGTKLILTYDKDAINKYRNENPTTTFFDGSIIRDNQTHTIALFYGLDYTEFGVREHHFQVAFHKSNLVLIFQGSTKAILPYSFVKLLDKQKKKVL